MFATTILGVTISAIWAFMLFVLWVVIAFWPANVAGRKGHSFIGFFILSLFFFPLSLLIAYMVDDRTHIQHATPSS
jgi:hypothetical protein